MPAVHVDAPLDRRLQPPPGAVGGLDPEDQAPRPPRARVRARPQVPLIVQPALHFTSEPALHQLLYTCIITPVNALYDTLSAVM